MVAFFGPLPEFGEFSSASKSPRFNKTDGRDFLRLPELEDAKKRTLYVVSRNMMLLYSCVSRCHLRHLHCWFNAVLSFNS